ncbi:hypothetical protein C8Q80DRAFT_1349911 [Daedaleopsis nitida]|nr:hypothetical protein C8Q80DRAFT_1349911 [Daedaleopsis nitida]
MPSTTRDLILILENYFPVGTPLSRALYVLSSLTALWPLWRLHRRQTQDPRQPRLTGWSKGLLAFLTGIAQGSEADEDGLQVEDAREIGEDIHADIQLLYELLGVDSSGNDPSTPISLGSNPLILCSPRLECTLCPTHPSLRRIKRHNAQSVKVLTAEMKWREATLFIAHCAACKADYYPDSFTYRVEGHKRRQQFEYDAAFLRISKHGLWADRRVAIAQDRALLRFRAGWSNFANWINDLLPHSPLITARQSQRLFLEHFSRRLLLAHNKHLDFSLPAHSNSSDLASHVRDVVGRDGGTLPTALEHGCLDCTHVKRYHSDLVEEGLNLAAPDAGPGDVAEIADEDEHFAAAPAVDVNPLPPGMPEAHVGQQEAIPGTACGYVCMAVMDGKTITHRKCALDNCTNPLVNYRSGRFCQDHLDLERICGIIPCGEPVHSPGAVTCNSVEHREWHMRWVSRFKRMSFPGVQRVIRRQQAQPAEPGGHRPSLHIDLPPLAAVPGDEVVHTFRAKTTYCLETVQWACGMPIGWGKCYRSESMPQVRAILNGIWPEEKAELCPSFMVFDDACDLLRHIVTQNPGDSWIQSTKFIVDAWHYIGHKATDLLCRLWCNPAPRGGSQPDLVLVHTDGQGVTRTVRAFNTETAEQFNAWLSGFEAQMRPMTDYNFDFFVHVLFMIYAEEVEKRVRKKGRELTDEFWDDAEKEM